ncbi:MAG: TIGR00730 family Rossman fold protein [Blautia sp.]|nr:TIGR00730 family Rossman fold protein [Blautia sp.]
MNITVYLGARDPGDQRLASAVRELGSWIGSNGHRLIYGGSKCGLMGELAESVLMAGGRVTGVEPQFFIDAGFEYNEITELIVTKDMSERKAKMIELGDAFIAFPGGTGTLEEISEVISKICLSHLKAPCIVYNLYGYYEGLKNLLSHMVGMKLASGEMLDKVIFAGSLEEIKDAVNIAGDGSVC